MPFKLACEAHFIDGHVTAKKKTFKTFKFATSEIRRKNRMRIEGQKSNP